MTYEELMNRFNRLRSFRELHYDAFYFFWTSLCLIMMGEEDISIDVETAFRTVMCRYCEDERYIDDIIRPVINHDGSLDSFRKYTRFGNDFYELGALWQSGIVNRDYTTIERTVEALTGFREIIQSVRNEILGLLEKEHVTFQRSFYVHYRQNNQKICKEYLKKLSWSIHTMIVAAELLEVFNQK